MSITNQLSEILDQYRNSDKNLKNSEEKNLIISDQKIIKKNSSRQEEQTINQKFEQLNLKKAEHDFDRAKHDFEFEKKYKPRILHWSVWILIAYLVWLIGIITIDYLLHLNDATNRLSNPVIIALASSTAVAIVGLPSLIVKSLFK
jgi:cation transport ATPase